MSNEIAYRDRTLIPATERQKQGYRRLLPAAGLSSDQVEAEINRIDGLRVSQALEEAKSHMDEAERTDRTMSAVRAGLLFKRCQQVDEFYSHATKEVTHG